MRFCSCDERTRVRKLRKQIYKKCVCAIHYIVHYTCTKNGNEYLMGCFVFFFNYIKSNSALCHCFLFFPDCFFQTINFSFTELYPDVWQIYPGRKKKKTKGMLSFYSGGWKSPVPGHWFVPGSVTVKAIQNRTAFMFYSLLWSLILCWPILCWRKADMLLVFTPHNS